MQIEIKCALNFLLSYLYDKLPRRRVNLFGDELEKYLKLKLAASDSRILLNINYNQAGMEFVDPCLILASKESAMDLKEVLECWPNQLKLSIEAGSVSYSLEQEFNSESTDKVIFNEKTDPFNVAESLTNNSFDLFQQNKNATKLDIAHSIQQQQQLQQTRRAIKNNKYNVNSNNKARGLNLNLSNLKPTYQYSSPTSPGSFANTAATSPYQTDFLSLSSSSSASASSSSSHLSNSHDDRLLDQLAASSPTNLCAKSPNISMFTTAAFAQTKFGSTKSKNNFTRQSKQQKMLPNEFSAYIRNKVKQLNNTTHNFARNFNQEAFVDYSLLNEQVRLFLLSTFERENVF